MASGGHEPNQGKKLRIRPMYSQGCRSAAEGKEYILSKQLLRAGTSIGANVEEAGAAQSKRDFIAKMSIASKEARETHYWLRLLTDTGYLNNETSRQLLDSCLELIKLLTAIVKTAQSNN